MFATFYGNKFAAYLGAPNLSTWRLMVEVFEGTVWCFLKLIGGVVN